MPVIEIYSTAICPYCTQAKLLLKNKGVQWQEIMITTQEEMQKMMQRSKRRTVPQIFIDDFHVGGYDDLVILNDSGKLDTLLKIE